MLLFSSGAAEGISVARRSPNAAAGYLTCGVKSPSLMDSTDLVLTDRSIEFPSEVKGQAACGLHPSGPIANVTGENTFDHLRAGMCTQVHINFSKSVLSHAGLAVDFGRRTLLWLGSRPSSRQLLHCKVIPVANAS